MRMSSARAGSRQAPRLQRQTSVLNELQESQEKENFETRNARLMAELSALCSDRNNVLTAESLEFLANDGRPEPVKLEREPEKILDALQKSALGAKQDDLLSADAARRQRVEELTRFFMEAKSDIEFALGGNHDFSNPRSSRDKDADSEHDEDKDNETGDDDDEADKSDEAIDPERQLAKIHIRLLKDKIDDRVYNTMLAQIRENDPALYGAILCHPLITGVDLKRDKRKKKKRKERERREKSVPAPSANAMLSPDFTSPRLSVEEMKMNIARFVARAIADGSIQAQLLAVKLILSWLLDSDQTDAHTLTLPLVSHLRVLRGEKAPEYPKRDVGTPKVSEQTEVLQQGEVTEVGQVFTEDKSTEEGSSITMDVEAESDSLTTLRARLGRFDDIEGEDDEGRRDHDDDEDDEDGESAAEGEGVDEDALMARAIALSLSPEVNLKDQSEAGPSPAALSGTIQPGQNSHSRPSRFSPEEMLGLGPFLLPEDNGEVSALSAALCLMAQVGKLCLEYLESCQKGVLPSSSSVQPHPVVFMLINSLLRDFIAPLPSWCDGEHDIAFWRLFVSCSQFSTLRALEAHLFHIEVANVSPASVGLGRIFIRGESDQVSGPNRLVESIKSLVEQCIEETKTSSEGCTDDRDVFESVFMSSGCSTADIDTVTDFYNSQVREHAVVAWARAIPHFYPTQLNRHDLLVGLLRKCLRSRERSGHHRWKYLQLDLLCSRLSLPDIAQGFVPQTGDVVLSTEEDENKNASVPIASTTDDQKLVDDTIIQTNGVKMFKKGKMWSGELIRASLASGHITPRVMIDFLVEVSSPDYMEKAGVTSLLSADTRAPEVLATAYEQFIENSRKEEQEALDCIKKLPDLVDLLRESVVDASWPLISLFSQLRLPHAPLSASIDKVAEGDVRTKNPRLMFLRSLQDLLVQRVGGARGDEPPALEFDATRCAETMTLSDGNKTARQYTAKQWGMVMATTGCPPNSGIHEWAVRLDRCEKGHIFLGVCTRDASVATYVGGDRQGWGLIGTRALWHNRSKVRGDYGDGFSTGSVVRVRLNTDSGALSFGVDDSDWGIAFDGLTQHGTLYPAIGLYQRDDQVTILPVHTIDTEQAEGAFTARGVWEISAPAILQPFLHHCAAVLDSTCRFLQSLDLDTMAKGLDVAEAERSLKQHPILFPLVLPLVSSLSTLKSFHGLSAILAMHLVPWCTKLVRLLDQKQLQLRSLDGLSTCLTANISGEWELKSMAAGNIPAQQYHLTLTQAADGTVTGKSSGSFTTVTLSGAVVGTKIRFLETWRQGGTCLVKGRLRADGSAFEGCYEDAKSHTSGSIVGYKVKTLLDSQDLQQMVTCLTKLSVLEVVCANLVGSFARALIDCDRPDLIIEQFTRTVTSEDDIVSDGASGVDSEGNTKASSECSSDEYESWVDSLLLSGGLPPAMVRHHLNGVITKVSDVTRIPLDESTRPALAIASREWLNFVTPKAATNVSLNDEKTGLDNDFVQDLINARGEAASVDRWVSRHVGESPFLRLGGEPMKIAKRTVCAAMLWHSGFLHLIRKLLRVSSDNIENSEERPHENLMHIWRAAQRVVEWAIRAKNSMGSTYAVVAALVIRKAEFLLKVEPSAKAVAASTAVSVLSQDGHGGPTPPARSAVYECAERIYSEVLMQVSRFLEAPVRISTIQSRMLAHSTKAFFRIIGMLSFRYFVGDVASSSSSTSSVSSGHEAIQHSFALSAAMQWLSPANHPNGTTRLVKEATSSENGDSVFLAAKNDAGHYLSGLGGCGKQLQGDIRDAFENLYGFLSAFLSKATWAHDADLQLVLLEAWGIVIQPDDHAFLSRVGIFRVLQTVLDDARSQDISSMDIRLGTDTSATTEERGRLAESRKCVIQATLKVVHLLAAQVAQDVTDAFAVPADTAVSSFGGLAVGAIPLLRKPSGPETLGKSVFHMLYTELKNALEDIRGKKSSDDNLVLQSSAEPAEGDQAPDSASLADANDSEEYCYQICSLLYSVSGSPVCRSHLSSSRWLRLLLVLLELGSLQIQRRALKLLRRILPDLDPVTIKLRPDAMDVFDVDSDDDCDDDATQDQAMTLINFFVGIVSSMNPPSLVEEMLRRLPGVVDNSCPKSELQNGSTTGLASEVVLLLRSLYESPKWSSHLSASLVEALHGLLTVKKSERSAPDSDVEMDDIGSRDLPSISSWVAQSRSYMNALAALCVLDGHVNSLRVGAAVKILPKTVAGMQDVSFRGARGIIVAYEPEKSAAEVLLKAHRPNDTTSARGSSSSPNRPIRVPVDDLVPVPDVELDTAVFSDDILKSILVEKFPFFVEEIRHSQESLKEIDGYSKGGDTSMDEPDEDDDMSNDGSSSPSGMDSEMVGGNDSDEGESEVGSPRTRVVDLNEEIEPNDVLAEMEKETQLQRMLLCQHGLRAIAMLLRDKRASETFIREGGSAKLYDLLQIAISETPTAGLIEVTALEESWVFLWLRWSEMRRAAASPAPKLTGEKKTDQESTDAESPPNPMVQQMMEMGFPKEWCEVALARCSQNVEAAINFCFEHSSDMERLVAMYKTSKEAAIADGAKSGRAEADALITPLLEQLAEMGFPLNWCKKALAANRNNVDAALTWILSNGEALEAEDRREEEAKQRAAEGGSSSVIDAPIVVDTLKPNPLRAVSGQASIGESDSMVEGLVGAGFPSVGAPDCLVSSGRWYYEATLHTNGCIQIGWADVAFCGAADRGDGVGDGAHSWAYDGWRQQKWHGQSSPWGSKWKQGDVVGCAVDVDAGTILFSLNGKMLSANMGVAFRGVQFAHGLYPCASFNRRERLQFNLGGSPFKHPPPPGFRPILEVLCREGETIADLPKGFAVIGRREDCLEEAVGEENYSSDSRFFGRELHSSMSRSSGSHHTRTTVLTGSSRADMFAELKAIPDDRVYTELVLLSRSLAVLHARRALLTLLAKWPLDQIGAFNMSCFSQHGARTANGATLFIDFIKLIASCSGGAGCPGGTTMGDSADIDEQLDYCSSGRQALSLLLSVTRSAIEDSLRQSIPQRHQLLDAVLARITDEVKSASERAYARVPWDSTDAQVTASFLQLSSESGQSWSDKEVLRHPNVFLAEWFSRLLMDSLSRFENILDKGIRNELQLELVKAWLVALKSPGLCVKEKAFGIIGGLLQDILLKAAISGSHEITSPAGRDLVTQVLHAVPLNRLLDLADERLLKEYSQLPVCSRYLQSIVELVSAGSLASNILGHSVDTLFSRDISKSVTASQKLEADLFDMNKKEYDEENEKRRRLAEEAAAKAAEEEAAAAAAAAAAASAATNTADSIDTSDSEGGRAPGTSGEIVDQPMQELDILPVNSSNDGGASGMEVDSDSEENPDITLSAIANMVAEDSDVVAAAAAIAAAAQGRLTIKHVAKTTSEENLVSAADDFELSFPEEKIVFDTSFLADEEKRLLAAGNEGILGDEPLAWSYGPELGLLSDNTAKMWSGQVTQFKLVDVAEGEPKIPDLTVGCKVIRGPNWKWRDQDGGEGSIGVVEGVSPWSGVEGEGMSVRWPNDSLYTYRWGADGNYDLIHVEVDQDGNITKRYSTPQVKPEDEGSFGCEVHLGVMLHIFEAGIGEVLNDGATKLRGVMEWPDFGSAIRVVGAKYADGRIIVQELQMIRGNPDMGWTLRFGSEKWQPGTKYHLRTSSEDNEILLGEYSHMARRSGKLVEVNGELKLSTKTLFTMDPYNHFSTLTVSDEGMTVTCNSGESRNLALGTVGFATGVHYWEVRVDQAEFGSVFIGVCEKAGPPGSQAALASRLNRWTGWGFVNFRATYHNSTERIYGDHFNAGDTIGVRLDMEQGKLSFFMDGMKFGEHIVADLGVAFENMKGERNTRTLYPCIGMRKCGDRVALNGKWVSIPGVSSRQLLSDVLDVSASLHSWYLSAHTPQPSFVKLSDELLRQSWQEWKRWNENRWQRYPVRPRGVLVDFDTYPSSCIKISNSVGLSAPFLAGDRVRISSTYGRELTQPEEAVILGVYRGHLWYRTETQGNEGADEGRSWAWYFSPSELAELLLVRRNGKDMTLIENSATDVDESLAMEAPFSPRSDLEAQAHTSFEAFIQIATKSHTPASDMQLVERLNTFSAASGVDIINLRIGDVLTPSEALEDKERVGVRKRSRTQSFVPDEYFSSPALKTLSGPELRARCAVLRVFNGKVLRALPLIALQSTDSAKDTIEVSSTSQSGVAAVGSSSDYPSTSVKLRSLRRLIFTSTKRSFWDDVLRATTTSTPLPSDEYEDPREIRTIRINRIQAQASKLSLLAQPSDRLRRSVFGQLYREMRTWNDSSFRRAYVGKGHGGQRRAFKVKFLGEGVNDYGGPYRAVFEQVVDELQMDNVELSKGEQGLLPLLIPCPNRRSGTGSNQDKFLLNPSCGASLVSNGPVALDLHRFLGKIVGTAVRHGLQMGLDLPSLVWRPLAGLDVGRAHLESVDVVTANNLTLVEEADERSASDILEYLSFSTTLSDGTEVPLCANGDKMPVTIENRAQYVDLVEKKRLTESQQQLAALRDGLSAVLPMELAPLFTPRELEVLICGRREVDVELLRQCTEYGEGVDESMTHVQAFWDVLKEMSSDERTSFLRFVWARSRMPNSAKDFPMNFKIQTAHDSGAQVDPDKYLPHAQTCFFALRLPAYTSKEVLRDKLLYAIQNSPNMDADVRLHNAEGWADA